MLKMVAEKNSSFIVSDVDMYGEKALYTIETLKKTQEQFKEKEIWFLIGSDNLKELHTWKCAEELVSKYRILVMEREKDNMEEIIKNNPLLLKNSKNFKKLNPDMKSNYNSTYVRQQIREGKSVRYLMPEEVYEYINKNKLYGE